MVILSVDYGDARTGIAVCDKFEMLASPLCVINEKYAPKLVCEIVQKIESSKAELVVVGLPKNMDGSLGFRAEKCMELGKLISESAGVAVEYQDERLTTVMAHDILHVNNKREKKHKSNVDAVSAVIILQSFIDSRKNSKS